jgi:hypothetical protein
MNHNIDRAKRKMVEAKIRPIPGYVLLNFNWFLVTNALFRRALLEDGPAALIKIPSACSPGLNFAVPLVGIRVGREDTKAIIAQRRGRCRTRLG